MKKNDLMFRPWKELKPEQDRQLHHFVTSQLYPFSLYYRRLFDKNGVDPDSIRTVDDLRRLPFTDKNDILDSGSDVPEDRTLAFLLKPSEDLIRKYFPKRELLKVSVETVFKGREDLKSRLEKEYKPIFLTATAGTTNRPISVLYTAYDIENLHVYGKRLMAIFGFKEEHMGVNVFPYAPHLAFWQTFFGGIAGDVFILSTGGGKTLGTDGNIHSILKVKPQFLIGVPSYVYHIIKTASEAGVRFPFLNRVILGAGRVPPGFKQKIATMLAAMGSAEIKVFGTYGFTEARAAWGECPTDITISSGYHTYPDKEIFEVVDPVTGEVKKEGEDGELVYSNIDSRGSCVLRYRTGDLVKGGIVYSPCPHCGRTVPRISSDILRASNIKNMRFSKVKDSLINLNSLERLLDDQPDIDYWQIEIVKKDNDPYEVDQLILNVSLLHEVDDDKFAAQLNQKMLSVEEVTFNEIHVMTRKEIQHKIEIESSVKAKKIVDRRP